MAVSVLLLNEDPCENVGGPFEAALAMLLECAAASGVATVYLEPNCEPTTSCYTREWELIDGGVPEMGPALIIALRTFFFGDNGRRAIGTTTLLDVDDIAYHQHPGDPMCFFHYEPILAVGDPWNRSLWNPASDGVALQFCRAESSRAPKPVDR